MITKKIMKTIPNQNRKEIQLKKKFEIWDWIKKNEKLKQAKKKKSLIR